MKKILFLLFLFLITASYFFAGYFLKKDKDIISWKPKIGDSFQWQLIDYPVDLSVKADIYDVDLFEVSADDIEKIHSKGSKVVCYINVGAVENFRDDYSKFDKSLIGKPYLGWEGESWLNISNFPKFSSILLFRFDLAKEKGCDGIEPDNMENFTEDTGFEISYDDQLEFNKWLAREIHRRGMAIALKNDPMQVNDLVDDFDFAIIEDCQVYGFCDSFSIFIKRGKPVFQIEYTDNDIDMEKLRNENKDYFKLIKHRDLDSWVKIIN